MKIHTRATHACQAPSLQNYTSPSSLYCFSWFGLVWAGIYNGPPPGLLLLLLLLPAAPGAR